MWAAVQHWNFHFLLFKALYVSNGGLRYVADGWEYGSDIELSDEDMDTDKLLEKTEKHGEKHLCHSL